MVEEPTVSVGAFLPLALDVQGIPHVCYYDQYVGALRYATRAGRHWIQSEIDTGPSMGIYCSIALDPDGEPRISYQAGGIADLKFAYRDEGTWTIETVDAIGGVGAYSSLVVDANGMPYVAYEDRTNNSIKYALKEGGTWFFETVVTPGTSDFYISLAHDNASNPRIAYRDANVGLRYAWRTLAGWQFDIVAEGNVSFCSLALDAEGNPHISYRDDTKGVVRYATKQGGTWHVETVGFEHELAYSTAIGVDSDGNPHIATVSLGNEDLLYARKSGGVWATEAIAPGEFTAVRVSLAVDEQGNPRIACGDFTEGTLHYASSAIELGDPGPGAKLWVGSQEMVTWGGTGLVDLYLSSDGGNSWQQLASQLSGGSHRMVVPHQPSKFSQLKLERAVPYSVSATNGFLTIETEIELLQFAVTPPIDGLSGAVLAWETNPGPEDLAGYRLERSLGTGLWQTLLALTQETGYHDAQATPGCRYRLYGINGLQQEFLLGETVFVSGSPLVARPLPYRGGDLTITFATTGGMGGGEGDAEVVLYDATGRRVSTIAAGRYTAGHYTVTWEGTADAGRRVAPGVYFLRSQSGGEAHVVKVVVLE
jgi:hypothetical protein